MRLLDRYIARQFLLNALVLFIILFGFVVTIDIAINMDRFVKVADMTANGGEPVDGFRRVVITALMILDLWWPRLLQLYNFLLGIVLAGAMGFTCVQLSRAREFVAMVAAGLPLHRVALPILAVSSGLIALQFINQELVIPRVAPLLTRDHRDAGKRTLDVAAVPLTHDGQGRLFHAREFDADAQTLRGLFVLERDDAGIATRVVRAAAATWDGSGWDLVDGRAEPRRDAMSDTAGARRPAPEPVLRIDTALDPTQLAMRRYEAYRFALSFGQLGKLLSRPDMTDPAIRDDLQRMRWGRLSVMASNLLTLLIAMPFFIGRLPRDLVGRTLRATPVIGAALMGGVLGALSEIPGLPAPVAVFVPVVILAPVAVAAVTSLRT